MPSVGIRTACGRHECRHCRMVLENPLRAADGLVGEIEPAVELAELEFLPLRPG